MSDLLVVDRPALRRGLFVFGLAFLLAGALFVAQRRIDWSYDEEGFQWYGAVATAHGDVPLRDFYSYDPGRYYWNAAWAKLLGDGILALRLSTALFGALGLACGLLAARRAVSRPWLLVPVGVVLLLWMIPRNKLFESALALLAVYAAVLLLEAPSRKRHVFAGAVVGLAGFFGKNLGAYLLLSFLVLILVQAWRWRPAESGGEEELPLDQRELPLRPRLLAWVGGVALGASPLLVLALFAPGFARSYLDSILFFFEQGRTNFPRPFPWPWRIRDAVTGWAYVQELANGVAFLLPPVFFAAALPWLATTRRETLRDRVLLVASWTVGLFYIHHMVSRADLAHLGSSFHPVLLGLVAFPAALRSGSAPRWVVRTVAAGVAVVLAFVTLFSALPTSPLYQRLTTDRFWPYSLAGEELLLRPRVTDLLDWATAAVAAHVPPGEPILMAPNMPGLYPVLGRHSPVWNVYAIWPSEGKLDRRMLAELQRGNVQWALIQNATVDGHDEFRFKNTHPETWGYLVTNFERVDTWKRGHPRRGMLLKRKGAVDLAGGEGQPVDPG